MLEATGSDVCDWLLSDGFESRLFTFFPCTDITPSVANKVRPGACRRHGAAGQGRRLRQGIRLHPTPRRRP